MQSTEQTATTNNPPDTTETETQTCDECDGRIRENSEKGELICEDCGLVIKEDTIDRGPEWRSFGDSKNSEQKSRVGAPIKEYLHDKGLTTNIGWQNKDANGNTVSSEKRRQISRLRTWNKRSKTTDAKERNLKLAFSEIQRMASALGLGEDIKETASVLYRRCVENDMLPGRSIEAMASAALYAASRICNVPRTLNEIRSVSRIDSDWNHDSNSELNSAYMYIVRELNLEMEPVDPRKYLNRVLNDIEVRDEQAVRNRAVELLDMAEKHNLHSGRSPVTLAGGAIYAGGGMENERVLQQEVAKSLGIAIATVRKRYQELVAVYEDKDMDEVSHEFK